MSNEPKFILMLAEGGVDEDEGKTKAELLAMLAEELGAKIVWPT